VDYFNIGAVKIIYYLPLYVDYGTGIEGFGKQKIALIKRQRQVTFSDEE
jgi:hypothetical protein